MKVCNFIQWVWGILVYLVLVMTIVVLILIVAVDHNVLRKFVFNHWDRNTYVNWDALPFTDFDRKTWPNMTKDE